MQRRYFIKNTTLASLGLFTYSPSSFAPSAKNQLLTIGSQAQVRHGIFYLPTTASSVQDFTLNIRHQRFFKNGYQASSEDLICYTFAVADNNYQLSSTGNNYHLLLESNKNAILNSTNDNWSDSQISVQLLEAGKLLWLEQEAYILPFHASTIINGRALDDGQIMQYQTIAAPLQSNQDLLIITKLKDENSSQQPLT